MPPLARLLVFLTTLSLAVGLLLATLRRFGLRLGRLPGDLAWRGRTWTVSLPLATSLLLSILLSLVLWGIRSVR